MVLERAKIAYIFKCNFAKIFRGTCPGTPKIIVLLTLTKLKCAKNSTLVLSQNIVIDFYYFVLQGCKGFLYGILHLFDFALYMKVHKYVSDFFLNLFLTTKS